jgi:fructose-1,6-bisphosphatase I
MANESNIELGRKGLGPSLEQRLMVQAERAPLQRSAAKVVLVLAKVATRISSLLAQGPYAAALGAATGAANADGDAQKSLDVIANDLVVEALKQTPTAYFASEEEDAVLTLAKSGLLAVAVDPLDGSSNIEINSPMGTIFSIYPAMREGAIASFLRPGHEQIAAGYFIYGSHTALVLAGGTGVDVYVLDAESATFCLAAEGVKIPRSCAEFAINASNLRQWHDPIRNYVDDCVAGADGPRGKNFNMRWLAAVVGEAHRILARGGVFLYPADKRRGYESGRLRQVYEAAPLALVIEAADGVATNGERRILDCIPASLHERTPLVFGSRDEVEIIARYHETGAASRSPSPLFAGRGLFRA